MPDDALVRSADQLESNYIWSDEMSDECLLAAVETMEAAMVEPSLYHG